MLPALMMQSSVEYLNSFRRVMSRYFSSAKYIVPHDHEAMYAYKCGLYEQCFHLSQESIDLLLYTLRHRLLHEAISERPDLLLLMDDDYLSLIGLARLCGVLSENSPQTMAEIIHQLALSMYLLVQSRL